MEKYLNSSTQLESIELKGRGKSFNEDFYENLEELLTWKNHGDKGFRVYNFEGNHFFINANVNNITKIINFTLIK